MNNPSFKEFCKEIRYVSASRMLFDVFSDFCEMYAIALANAVDLRKTVRDTRENRYLQIIKRYNADEVKRIAKLTALTVEGSTADCDFLGRAFCELELGNSDAGQFFTPYSVSRMMAEMYREGIDGAIHERGFVTVCEPSLGAGGMILALADMMKDKQYNPQRQLHVTGVDIDLRAVHMAYIQLSLAGIPAVIYHGNTLSNERWSEWKTPFHILHNWDARLKSDDRRGQMLHLIKDTTQLEQADIFAEAV